MKYLLSLPIVIAAVAAQGNLNGCGQLCWNDMLAQASSLGCSAGDMKCLCSNPNFQNGLNDCSHEACGDAVRAAVVAYGRSQCGNQAAQGGTSAGGASTTGPPPATTTTETTMSSEATSESTVTVGGHNSTTTTAGTETSSTAVRTVSGTTATAGGVTTTGVNNPATSTNLAMKIAGPFAGAGAFGLAAVFLPLI